MRFFRPDAPRLILFALFLVIAFLGSREAVEFNRDGDLVPTSGAWTLWVALLAPLGVLLLGFKKIGIPLQDIVFHDSPVVMWTVQVVYFYLIACVLAALFVALRRKVTAARR